METTKICPRCNQEKPITDFVNDARRKSGYGTYCKSCHSAICKESRARKLAKAEIKYPVKVNAETVKECKESNLEKVPSRLLISELRRRGYRGELELVTIQKVVI